MFIRQTRTNGGGGGVSNKKKDCVRCLEVNVREVRRMGRLVFELDRCDGFPFPSTRRSERARSSLELSRLSAA